MYNALSWILVQTIAVAILDMFILRNKWIHKYILVVCLYWIVLHSALHASSSMTFTYSTADLWLILRSTVCPSTVCTQALTCIKQLGIQKQARWARGGVTHQRNIKPLNGSRTIDVKNNSGMGVNFRNLKVVDFEDNIDVIMFNRNSDVQTRDDYTNVF